MPFSQQKLDGYNAKLIDALQLAFADVWTTLYAHVPIDGDAAIKLKIELSRTLVALAANGITDRQELRRRALEGMALTP